jgi:hypothetical protein
MVAIPMALNLGLPRTLPFAVDFGPILKLRNEKFAFQVRYPLRESRLNILYCTVIDDGPNFFDEEREQQSGGQVADWLGHVFFKVTFDGSNGIFARFGRDFYHWWGAPDGQVITRRSPAHGNQHSARPDM